jgi:hypothetical protein
LKVAVDGILHLSLPVRDLAEARAFYVDVLGCRPGRRRERWADVWFFGMQLTLQDQPDAVVPESERGARHFGVTLRRDQLDALVRRLRAHPVRWVREPTTDYAGTLQEQTKAMILDPSGNAIELKAYVDAPAALETPAAAWRPGRSP